MSGLFINLSKTHKLLKKELNNSVVKASPARKYVDNYYLYVAEKMHAIEHAELKQNSKCLDISTGSGLLPYMLRKLGHTCDATDILDPRDDMDTDVENGTVTQVDAFTVLRKIHGVSITNLKIEKSMPVKLTSKYDCIFSTRVVWDTGWGKDKENYQIIVNSLLDYADKVVISWNMDGIKDIPPVLLPYVVQDQFEYGTLTVHTEKII